MRLLLLLQLLLQLDDQLPLCLQLLLHLLEGGECGRVHGESGDGEGGEAKGS